jgi:CheY-like chemotaxis protein
MRVRLPVVSRPGALPRHDDILHAMTAAPTAGPFRHARLSGRVMVLDDDADARELMARALTHAGADVMLAASAQEARGLLDRSRPDVIISDIGMPGEDGYTSLKQLKERGNGRFRDVPVIAVTAYARQTDRANVLASGFRTHLSKPVDLDVLAGW